ncbi:adenylyl-sulfate kinase [Paraburkholderia aspalathi]|uniref:adenylyl-sulfate kinase n=1 Tax=Paraburkholderia nemoris TaxID=2793076 RepID=UPI00190C1A69|nr:adenylyl-sulfate kinase [Paraburkholderia aspalathi]
MGEHSPHSCVLPFTGLSGADKPTIAEELLGRLCELNINAIILDGDTFRMGLSSNLRYSSAARLRRVAYTQDHLSSRAFSTMRLHGHCRYNFTRAKPSRCRYISHIQNIACA